MKSKHVEHPDVGNRATEQLRLLRDACAHQKAAVGPAGDPDPVRPRPPGFGQPAGARAEVVEHVLLVAQAAGVMPRPAVLTAAAEVGDGQNSSPVQPGGEGHGKSRGNRNIESPVPVEQDAPVTLRPHVAPAGEEHGHPGAVD